MNSKHGDLKKELEDEDSEHELNRSSENTKMNTESENILVGQRSSTEGFDDLNDLLGLSGGLGMGEGFGFPQSLDKFEMPGANTKYQVPQTPNVVQTMNELVREKVKEDEESAKEEEKSKPDVTAPSTDVPTGSLPKLQNIVSTLNLKCELDLRQIALKSRNAEYNPRRFAAVIMRIREPKTTALIFSSGKMVCTGARSEEDSRKAARQYAKIVAKLGFPVKFTEFKVQNIVGSCDIGFPIKLEAFAVNQSRFCNYEPEMFPGLIYRMYSPKVVLLIFVSGKIVLTGAKFREDIYEAYRNIYPILSNFKKAVDPIEA